MGSRLYSSFTPQKMLKTTPEWSKSYPFHKKDNIPSHKYIGAKHFKASYETEACPPSMNLLLSWEYARIWHREHEEYLKKRKESEKMKMPKKREYKRRVAPQKKTEELYLKRSKYRKQKVVCDENDEIIKHNKPQEMAKDEKGSGQKIKKFDKGTQKDLCNCKCPKKH